MSARFVSGSSQILENTAPAVTTFPITVGVWVRPASPPTVSVIWSVGSTISALNLMRFQISAGQWQISVADGSDATSNAGAATNNAWAFLVARFISATNWRLSVLNPTGQAQHTQGTTSKSPSNINRMYWGARYNTSPGFYWDGLIAEGWYTNTDIQADGAQLKDSMLRQLAYYGPFSIPSIRKDIVEYRSFRSRGLDSRSDRPDEVYWGRFGRQTWSNVNGVTMGPHPPAARHYVPSREGRILVPV